MVCIELFVNFETYRNRSSTTDCRSWCQQILQRYSRMNMKCKRERERERDGWIKNTKENILVSRFSTLDSTAEMVKLVWWRHMPRKYFVIFNRCLALMIYNWWLDENMNKENNSNNVHIFCCSLQFFVEFSWGKYVARIEISRPKSFVSLFYNRYRNKRSLSLF
jgi:hypothetical protein